MIKLRGEPALSSASGLQGPMATGASLRNRISATSIALLAFVFPTAALAQLTILPTSQTISNAGNSATYGATVTNPTGTTQTFVPSTSGITAAWGVQLPASVVVAPGGTQNFNLVLTTPFNAAPGPYPFLLNVNSLGGLSYSAPATLIITAPGTPGPSATPAPPSLVLTFLGLAGLGIYAARPRRRQVFTGR